MKDAGGKVLLVSQFTLYASMKKTRPDFRAAQKGDHAVETFDTVVREVDDFMGKDSDGKSRVETGEFGAKMSVALANEGPVTIILDSRDRKGPRPAAVPRSEDSGSSKPGAGAAAGGAGGTSAAASAEAAKPQ